MLRLYRLKFLSPSTEIRAYTLFGAICWAYRLLGGDVEKLCEKFQQEPPFLISSPFPILKAQVGNDCTLTEIPLLPKPILPIAKEFSREDDICKKVNRKPVKKAQYITVRAFERLIELGSLEERAFYSDKFKAVEGFKRAIALDKEEIYNSVSKVRKDVSVRNVLDRRTMKSVNLFTEEISYFPDMYFIVKYLDVSFVDTVETCLLLIEDLGLGANKNIGWGKVRIKEDTETFKELVEFIKQRLDLGANGTFVSLSPVLPKKGMLDLENSFYQVEPYKSPVDTTFGYDFAWKKKVLYLREGSVIKKKQDGYVGQLKDVSVDLEDGKKVKAFQYGFEFPIGLEV